MIGVRTSHTGARCAAVAVRVTGARRRECRRVHAAGHADRPDRGLATGRRTAWGGPGCRGVRSGRRRRCPVLRLHFRPRPRADPGVVRRRSRRGRLHGPGRWRWLDDVHPRVRAAAGQDRRRRAADLDHRQDRVTRCGRDRPHRPSRDDDRGGAPVHDAGSHRCVPGCRGHPGSAPWSHPDRLDRGERAGQRRRPRSGQRAGQWQRSERDARPGEQPRGHGDACSSPTPKPTRTPKPTKTPKPTPKPTRTPNPGEGGGGNPGNGNGGNPGNGNGGPGGGG